MGMLDYVRMKTRERLMRGERVHWVEASPRRTYIRQVILSAPPWVDRLALRLIQQRCRQLTELTGVDHQVSHIVPLNHPRMCGLTVPWNLTIKTAVVNMAESNHVPLDGQLALFE